MAAPFRNKSPARLGDRLCTSRIHTFCFEPARPHNRLDIAYPSDRPTRLAGTSHSLPTLFVHIIGGDIDTCRRLGCLRRRILQRAFDRLSFVNSPLDDFDSIVGLACLKKPHLETYQPYKMARSGPSVGLRQLVLILPLFLVLIARPVLSTASPQPVQLLALQEDTFDLGKREPGLTHSSALNGSFRLERRASHKKVAAKKTSKKTKKVAKKTSSSKAVTTAKKSKATAKKSTSARKAVTTTKKAAATKKVVTTSKKAAAAATTTKKAAAKSTAVARPSAVTKLGAYAGPQWAGTSTYVQQGNSGVSAMQMAVVSDRYVIFFDKAEQNALRSANGNHAWSSLLDPQTSTVRALNPTTNSFCAGGGWLSNGTLVNIGGNPREGVTNTKNGLMALRMFTPRADGSGDIYENPSRIRLTSYRWYPSSARLSDGSLIIWGGMIAGGFNNVKNTDNPTIEYFPAKGNGQPIYSPFLHDALNSNLFPFLWALPDNTLFVAANKLTMIYNWKTNTETRLPTLPMRVTYPWSAGGVMLPLTPENNYTPEILFCGGSNINDRIAATKMSSQTPAANICARMVLNKAGIAKGWQTETMPGHRTMGDAILTPDGSVLFINGAQTGLAGYGNVANQVGHSNADHPVLTPWLYTPSAPAGSRFTTGFASSTIARMYHSTASLLPDGRIIIAGSNPNPDVTTAKYATTYKIEYFSPPYMFQTRPTYTNYPSNILYASNFTLTGVTLPANTKSVTVTLIDLAFHTHANAMDSRMVTLVCSVDSTGTIISATGPPNGYIFPPGYGWVYVVADGVPSRGHRIMIGDGSNPPESAKATAGALAFGGYSYSNSKAVGSVTPQNGG
ncbi:hypothetical protein E5Q_05800 [Mixia osmundae IAM 14324]|uniref:Galactose oxidase-like Early set domain-containing protein n=1 Tax=Mixia osmundae (strain CBS 9802 / IAM 14324 / JCM 22182 / KY 12970) TaxID=764103 RepID=G7E8F1_MIXOS|nr:hypothetical protein E5Q_05800 [Mixia osmundae IAM 14324]